MRYSIVLTTCAARDEAERIASHLLNNKLAACVQISKITSYYTWKGRTHKDPEYRLLIKTQKKLYRKIEDCIIDMHSYQVPEIIQIPVQTGLQKYFDWVDEMTA